MIIGTGIDMVDIRRIEKLLAANEERFLARTYTEAEVTYAQSKPAQKAGIYAKRFAAKEAFAKAMGTGIGEHVAFTDIEVINDGKGKPTLMLHGAAAEWLAGKQAVVHLSLSDEAPYAIAQVIIEAPSVQV